MLETILDGLIPMIGVVLIFGAIPAVILVGVTMYLKNCRYKVEQQSKLISQMIEKGDAANIDFKSLSEILDSSNTKQKTKQSILKHLNAGIFLGLLGLFMLVVGIILERGAEPIVVGDGLLVAGLAFIASFFISKKYFKQEIEAEEQQLTENK